MPKNWNPLTNLEDTRALVQRMVEQGLASRPVKLMSPEEIDQAKNKISQKEFREREKQYGAQDNTLD